MLTRLACLLAALTTLCAGDVHTVEVGASGLVFTPRTFSAKVGDQVIFKFYPQHNVGTAAFDKPCQPNTGFYSGPFSDTNNGQKKFVVNVTSDAATYYYCSVARHCQSGMVGGWNIPNSGDGTIDQFASAASGVAAAASPTAVGGGQLLDDAAIASLTASVAASASTASASSSASAASASAVSTASRASASASSASAASAASAASTASHAAAPTMGVQGAAAIVGFAALFI